MAPWRRGGADGRADPPFEASRRRQVQTIRFDCRLQCALRREERLARLTLAQVVIDLHLAYQIQLAVQ